jgi:hypothetical protein
LQTMQLLFSRFLVAQSSFSNLVVFALLVHDCGFFLGYHLGWLANEHGT